jgi:integrase
MLLFAITDHTERTTGGNSIRKTNRSERLSPDGLWRSFPKVPGLLQYVKSGTFYGRLKVSGKLIRRSLHKDGEPEIPFTTAKLRLRDFIKKERTKKPLAGTFANARQAYETALERNHTLGDTSKRYRRFCIQRLLTSWPKLDATPLDKITLADCEAWAARFAAEVDEVYFNNILGTLRGILKAGGMPDADNPALALKRLGVNKTVLHLPELEQFAKIVETIETAGGRESKNRADLVRFLAFSGCRISEARQVTWADVDTERGLITVHNAKVRRAANSEDLRLVPIIPDMAALLAKLRQSNPQPTDRVCRVGECEKSLTRACKKTGAERITHHDLRHLFATRCIESGVDIPTVSRWLGHHDGGALAMRVYGHLRVSDSTAMAKLVTFTKQTADNIIPMEAANVG